MIKATPSFIFNISLVLKSVEEMEVEIQILGWITPILQSLQSESFLSQNQFSFFLGDWGQNLNPYLNPNLRLDYTNSPITAIRIISQCTFSNPLFSPPSHSLDNCHRYSQALFCIEFKFDKNLIKRKWDKLTCNGVLSQIENLPTPFLRL